MKTVSSRWITPFLWFIVIVLAIRFAVMSASVITRRSDGFAAYYTAGRLLSSGQAGPKFYDDAWYSKQVATFAPGVKDIYNANPPTTAFMMLPLSWMSYAGARTIWIILTFALVAAVLFLIVRESDLQGPYAPVFVGLALASQPLAANMRQGQVYVLLLLLAALTWISFRRRLDVAAGVSLALLLVLKTAGILLPALFLLRHRWRSLAWTAATGVAAVVVSLVWTSPAMWSAYILYVLNLRREPDLSVTAYQSMASLSRHLLVFDAEWNPEPLLRAPMLGAWLPILIAIMMMGATIITAIHVRQDDLCFAALLVLTIVLSPVSLDYHYTLLLLPVAIMMARLQGTGYRWSWLVLTVSTMLIFADLPYGSARFSHGVWALLAYPKLVGGLLLWGQSLWYLHRRPHPAVSTPARLAVLPG